MKRIFLIRHAKSSWADHTIRDFHRPLNKRGMKNAPVMAQRFLEQHGVIDKIISSPAERAITTAKVFATRLAIPADQIKEIPCIYQATPEILMNIITEFDEQWNTVIMFGHNPGFSHLSEALTGEFYDKVTCSISEIELHIENWMHCASGLGSLTSYDFPKNT